MKPTTEKRARWVQCPLSLAVALMIFAICGWVLRIDVVNNYHLGARVLEELGQLFAVGAIAYALFPAAARLRGAWCSVTIGATAVAGLITLGASYLAYSGAQNSKVDRVTEQQQRVGVARAKRERAEADLAEARKEMAAISERRSSKALRELYEDAMRRKAEESSEARGGCKPTVVVNGKREDSRCIKAEREAAEYLRLIGDAEARERWEAKAEAAKALIASVEGDADAPLPEQDLAAVDLAYNLDISPESAGRIIARASSILAMLLTAFLGLAMHTATGFMMTAFGIRPLLREIEPAPSGLAVVAPPPPVKPALPKPAAKKGRPKKTPQERIKQFAAERLKPAATVQQQATGAQMHEAFEDWWHVNAPGIRMPDQKLVAEVLKKQGIEKAKRGGKVRWSARIEKVEA